MHPKLLNSTRLTGGQLYSDTCPYKAFILLPYLVGSYYISLMPVPTSRASRDFEQKFTEAIKTKLCSTQVPSNSDLFRWS